MNLYTVKLQPYIEPVDVPLGEIKEGPLSSIPKEIVQYAFSFFSCRDLATFASVSKKWQKYSKEALIEYKFAILATALELHKALMPHRREIEYQISWLNYKERFMNEYLAPARMNLYERACACVKGVLVQPRFNEQIFDCISKLDQELTQRFTWILLPPSSNNRPMKHAIFYLRLSLKLKSLFYICPLSASAQLIKLSAMKVEVLMVHRIFLKDLQIISAFKKHLPEFKMLKAIIVTSCGEDHGPLKPLLKMINQIGSLQAVTFFSAGLSDGDLDQILGYCRDRNVCFQYESNVSGAGIGRMESSFGPNFKRVGC